MDTLRPPGAKEAGLSIVTVKELVESGVHFGHQASRWNPKMRPYIFGKRNLIHVIDLKETVRGLLRARHFLTRLASVGAQILFVGTKRQIKDLVAGEAERVGMPLVIERWIGGSLTNYHTIRSRLDRLEELEKLERDGTLERYSKKVQSRLRREMRKITRNLGGIRNLEGLPGAVLIVDPRREEIAVKEAAKMNVSIVAILDTDCDPELIDIPIPGNDDALRSVQVLLSRIVDGIAEGLQNMDREAVRFRSEVPEIKGREEREPASRAAGRAGSRPGTVDRVAGGRFAQRAGGPAQSVSFGRQTQEEVEADQAKAEREAKTKAPEGEAAQERKEEDPEPGEKAVEPPPEAPKDEGAGD